MPATISDTSCSAHLCLDLKAPNLVYFVHNCWTNIKIENVFNRVVISSPHKQLLSYSVCNYLAVLNVNHNHSDKTTEIPLTDTSLLKEFERTKPCCMLMGTNSSTDKNAKSSSKCFRPQGI